MSIRPSNRIVLASVPALAVCVTRVKEITEQTTRVDVMSCCVKHIDVCIPQGAAKVFKFQDEATVDYSGASEITFDVWDSVRDGSTNRLSLSMTGGDITLPNDYTFQFTLDGATTYDLPYGKLHCEAWVTLSGGEQRLVGAGVFEVVNTRKYDA